MQSDNNRSISGLFLFRHFAHRGFIISYVCVYINIIKSNNFITRITSIRVIKLLNLIFRKLSEVTSPAQSSTNLGEYERTFYFFLSLMYCTLIFSANSASLNTFGWKYICIYVTLTYTPVFDAGGFLKPSLRDTRDIKYRYLNVLNESFS